MSIMLDILWQEVSADILRTAGIRMYYAGQHYALGSESADDHTVVQEPRFLYL